MAKVPSVSSCAATSNVIIYHFYRLPCLGENSIRPAAETFVVRTKKSQFVIKSSIVTSPLSVENGRQLRKNYFSPRLVQQQQQAVRRRLVKEKSGCYVKMVSSVAEFIRKMRNT